MLDKRFFQRCGDRIYTAITIWAYSRHAGIIYFEKPITADFIDFSYAHFVVLTDFDNQGRDVYLHFDT